MSNVPKLTLRGLYDYTDGGIFELLQIPDGLDRQDFINRLLFTRGELGVLFPDPDWLKAAIGSWSVNWISNFTRIYATLEADYNPLHNYDRHEEYTDTYGEGRSGTSNGSGRTDGGNENMVSAFNESSYQPESKTVTGDMYSNQGAFSERKDSGTTHEGHLYGNIGTTKSQEMVQDETDLRLRLGIYDIMSDVFAQELLLLVY